MHNSCGCLRQQLVHDDDGDNGSASHKINITLIHETFKIDKLVFKTLVASEIRLMRNDQICK